MTGPSYDQAVAEVRAIVAASRTSFGAGMAVLPRARREGMYGLYAFCRVVDDIADDGATEATRRRDLDLWRAKIDDLFQNDTAADAITVVLQRAHKLFALEKDDLLAIIDGMEMDAGAPIQAPDVATLDLYCDRVASAVGRASVCLFGAPGEKGRRVAYHLGRAFQLTNILRDLAEDAARARLYLPREILDRHALAHDPQTAVHDPQIAKACRDLAQEARLHFTLADSAMAACPRAAMRPAMLMRAYYGAIFDKLLAADWRQPLQRVTLGKAQKIWLLVRALARSYF